MSYPTPGTPFVPAIDRTAADYPAGHHRRVTLRVTARSMSRLRAIVQSVAEELATWPHVCLVACELGRFTDYSLRSDLGAWLTYEVPPSAGHVTGRNVEDRAYSWVDGPADLRAYENIRFVGEVSRGAALAS